MQQFIKTDTRKVTTQLRNCRDFNRLITLMQSQNKDLINKNTTVVDTTEIVITYNEVVNEIEYICGNTGSNEVDTTKLVFVINKLLNAINRLNNY